MFLYMLLLMVGIRTKKRQEVFKKLFDNLNGAKLASVSGRYYAMDRDESMERIRVVKI